MAQDRRRSIGGEMAALALIVVCLIGALGSVVAVYRRVNRAQRSPGPVAQAPRIVAPAPAPVLAPEPLAPAPIVVKAPVRPQPRPKPEPPPVDPTAPVLAGLTAAEAEQLLAASQSNRRAQALEDARRMAEAESERLRRRQSLIHAQLDTIEGRVRRAEAEIDALALERDALQVERDARKAAVARARSRPSQAILPHKGPNGTWRRPIVVECRNGEAVLQPRGLVFGLMDLESDLFGMANPFVSAVAREAARVQHQATPDGAPAVPYVFFLVRPDGIRPYYEARGRLESLGVTFGYELADQDWVVDFPDLDDLVTWDGSAPSNPAPPQPGRAGVAASGLASGTQPSVGRGPGIGNGNSLGIGSAEDVDLPVWPKPRGGGTGADPFTFGGPTRPSSALSRLAHGGRNPREAEATLGAGGGGSGSGGGLPGQPDPARPGGPGAGETPAISPPTSRVEGSIVGEGSAAGRAPTLAAPPVELALGGTTAGGGAPGPASDTEPAGEPVGAGPTAEPKLDPVNPSEGNDALETKDPARGFVFQGHPADKSDARAAAASEVSDDQAGRPGGDSTDPSLISPDTASGGGSVATEGRPGSGGGTQASRHQLGSTAPSGAAPAAPPSGPVLPPQGLGLPSGGLTQAGPPPRPMPSPSSLPDRPMDLSQVPNLDHLPPVPPVPLPRNLPIPRNLPTPREAGAAVQRQLRPDALGTATAPVPAPNQPAASSSANSRIDRTFEVVVVCGPDGVIVQPGNYRLTAAALREQEGLFKRQIVGLVKARRAADPAAPVEPRIHFLIQPRGVETYRAARSQFFVSGLGWPTSTQVADPDPLVIRSRGVW